MARSAPPDTGAPGAAPGTPSGPCPGSASPAERGRGTGFRDRTLVLVTAAVSLPLVWMGYGTDLDIGDVLATGARIRDLDYAPSRNPGVPVVEAVVAVLDPIGGHVLVNLATAAALAATVVGIARLTRAWGHANGDLLALAFLASPIAVISGTQTADFLWATAFLVWGAVALVRGRVVPAALLLALAVGSRSSTVLLVVALLAAVGWDRRQRRAAGGTAALALPAAALLFVPAWLSHDRTLGFLDAADGWVSLPNNLARFLLKNYAVAGVALAVVLVLAAPTLLRALRNWDADPMLRFAVLGLVATEVLFLRMPWKPAHLVPSLLALVLWIGASGANRRRFLWVVVAAVALNGLVVFRPFVADEPNSTGGGDFEPAITLGWLANDVRCRLEYMDQPPRLGSGAWGCTLEPMRGPARGATGTLH
ncbi:MAG TPA: hypothetical protein VFZ77_17910 [Acidimicrobiales bacterium]